jgi:hypothetical protein
VLADDLEVDVERPHDAIDRELEVVARPQHDPAEVADRGGLVGHVCGGVLDGDDDQPLVHGRRVRHLQAAGIRRQRRDADHEQHRVGPLDRFVCRVLPAVGRFDLAVRPDLAAAAPQRGTQPLDEIFVLMRVRDEDVSHADGGRRYPRTGSGAWAPSPGVPRSASRSRPHPGLSRC